MADYQTELSQSGNTLYLKPADGFERSTKFGDSTSHTHHFSGSVYISGALYANEYRVNEINTVSGSTVLGNSSDDTHQFTGSVHMAHDLHVAGTIFGGSPVKIGGGMTVSGTLDMSGSTDFGSDVSHNHVFTGSILQSGSGGTNHFRDSNVFGQTSDHTHRVTGSMYMKHNVYVDQSLSGSWVIAGNNVSDDDEAIFLANGSTILGRVLANNHNITGSVRISGSTHIVDDKRIYFGTDDDISLRYYSDSDRLILDGDLLIEDDKKLRFGTNNDVTMEYDEDGTDHFRIVGWHTTIDNSGAGTFTVTGSTTLVGNLTSNNGAFKIESSGMGGTSAVLTGSLTIHSGNVSLTDAQAIQIGEGSIAVDSSSSPYSMVLSPEDGIELSMQTKASGKLIVSPRASHTGSTAFEVHYTGSNSPTSLSDGKGGGEVVYFGTGSVTQGKLYYLNTDGGWAEADASGTGAGGNTPSPASDAMMGIALGTEPGADGILLDGFAKVQTYFAGGFQKGKAVYMSETSGYFTNTKPTTNKSSIRIIGYSTDTDYVIWFSPDPTWVEIA